MSVLVIAAKDLRQRLRDRSAIVIGLVAPLVIAALMSLAFQGVEGFHFTMGVVRIDRGPLTSALVAALRDRDLRSIVTIRLITDRREAGAALRERSIQAALVIPAGFSSSVVGAHPLALKVLTSVDSATAGDITASLASSFVAQLNADRLSVATALAAGVPPQSAASLAQEAATLRIPEQVLQRGAGAKPLKAVSYYSPAMAIFFALFLVSFSARSFFADRSQGMIERMRAAPLRPLEILAGKALSVFVFGISSLAVVAIVTTLVFGAQWGSPLQVAAVCGAMVLAIVCLTAIVIGVARTQRQAEGIASAVVFGLALLGGNFIMISSEPEVMRRLALLTPNGWALRAFSDLATIGGGWHTVAEPLAAMLAFSVVTGGIAILLAKRAVTS